MPASTIPVLTPEQAAAWDQRAEREGMPLESLMENAGRGAAAVLLDRYGHAARRGVLVATGPGHNGGDGWVVARTLHALGIPVWVASTGEKAPLTAKVAARARAAGVQEVPADGPWPPVGLLVDALLGTGGRWESNGPVVTLLFRLLESQLPIVGIDGPTGIDLRTGEVYCVARADLTITFGGVRRGHLMARDSVGDIVVIDIGHPPADPALPTLWTDDVASERLHSLHPHAYKGSRGRVVCVGGAPGMSGALRLSARAAFAAGAGLVFTLSPAESAALIAQAEPDVQARSWTGKVESAELKELLQNAHCLVIGPGLGRGAGIKEAILSAQPPTSPTGPAAIVLDADGLMAFAGDGAELKSLVIEDETVLTPHLGEFKALFPAHAETALQDPWSAAAAAAKECGAVVLLKGVPTVIATPEGTLLTVAAGNPGLATGGSGDVLSGLIGAFLAGNYDPEIAAALGAQALGRAGDLAARRTSARTMRPMDVIAAFPDLWRSWELRGASGRAPRAPVLVELERPRTS